MIGQDPGQIGQGQIGQLVLGDPNLAEQLRARMEALKRAFVGTFGHLGQAESWQGGGGQGGGMDMGFLKGLMNSGGGQSGGSGG